MDILALKNGKRICIELKTGQSLSINNDSNKCFVTGVFKKEKIKKTTANICMAQVVLLSYLHNENEKNKIEEGYVVYLDNKTFNWDASKLHCLWQHISKKELQSKTSALLYREFITS